MGGFYLKKYLTESYYQLYHGYMLNVSGTYSLTEIAKSLGVTTAAVSKTGDYFKLESLADGRGKNSEYPEAVFNVFKAIAIFRSLDFSLKEIKELRELEFKIFDAAKYYFYESSKGKAEKPKTPKGLEGFERVGVIRMLLLADYCPVSTRSIDIDNWEFQKGLKSGDKEAVVLNTLLEQRNKWLKIMLDKNKDVLEKIKEEERRAKEAIEMIKSTVGLSTY